VPASGSGVGIAASGRAGKVPGPAAKVDRSSRIERGEPGTVRALGPEPPRRRRPRRHSRPPGAASSRWGRAGLAAQSLVTAAAGFVGGLLPLMAGIVHSDGR